MTGNAFPIRPQPEDDPRFQPFLIAKESMTNKDRADFMMALWRFLYSDRED